LGRKNLFLFVGLGEALEVVGVELNRDWFVIEIANVESFLDN